MNFVLLKDIVFGYFYMFVLDKVLFDIESGEFVGIIGLNGVFKLMFMKVMFGMLKLWEGIVMISKRNIEGKCLMIGYVLQ